MPALRISSLLLVLLVVPAVAGAQTGTLGVFHPSNTHTLVSTGADAVSVFEAATGKRVAVLEADGPWEIAVSANGEYVAVAARNGIALFSYGRKEFLRLLSPTPPGGYKPGSGNRVAFVGTTLTALYRGIGYAFDPSTGRQLAAWVESAMASNQQVGVVRVLAGNPAAMTLASGDHSQLTVREAASGKQIWQKSFRAPEGRQRPELLSAAFSPDGKLLVTGHSDGFVRLWNAATGELQDVRPVSKGEVISVAVSPNGRLIGTVDSTGRSDLWSMISGESLGGGQDQGALSVSFSPDSQSISVPVSTGRHQLYRIDADDTNATPKTPNLSAAGWNEGGASVARQPEWLTTKALIEIAQFSLMAAEEFTKTAPKTSVALDRASVSVIQALAATARQIPELAAAAAPAGAVDAAMPRGARFKITQMLAEAADRESRVSSSNRMAYLIGEHAGTFRVVMLINAHLRQTGEKVALPVTLEEGLKNLIAQTDLRKTDLPPDLVQNISNLRGIAQEEWPARLDAIIGLDPKIWR